MELFLDQSKSLLNDMLILSSENEGDIIELIVSQKAELRSGESAAIQAKLLRRSLRV